METDKTVLVAIIFSIFIIGIVSIAAFVWHQAKNVGDGKAVKKRLYRIRSSYFILLLTVLITLLGFTLNGLPYPGNKDVEPDFTVSVVGIQWVWKLAEGNIEENGLDYSNQRDLVIPVRKEIEFQVTATDVNHGCGIYNDEGSLLVQTQAMPGYVNRLRYRFKTPGTYHLVCMEFCGVAHQGMVSKLDVK